MLALEITNLKHFMNNLLTKDTFDDFLLREATLLMGISYVIDGTYNSDFFTDEEKEQSACPFDYAAWSIVRPTMFDLIKGKKTPLAFQLTFYLPTNTSEKLLGQPLTACGVKSLVCNIKYDKNKILITSCINYATFTLDKSLEPLWDSYLLEFLKKSEISFDALL
ncbi:MAG: DUF5721 family protein [Lachnospiraceae bacterium]